jgi:hypothetical protein
MNCESAISHSSPAITARFDLCSQFYFSLHYFLELAASCPSHAQICIHVPLSPVILSTHRYKEFVS